MSCRNISNDSKEKKLLMARNSFVIQYPCRHQLAETFPLRHPAENKASHTPVKQFYSALRVLFLSASHYPPR